VSATTADLHLLIQFPVNRTSYRAAFIALHIRRQVARSGLPMADRRLPAGVGGGCRRIGLAGRRRIAGGVCRVLSECHAQDNGAEHCRPSDEPRDGPRDGPRSETVPNVICESWSHLRLLDWERRCWMARSIDDRSTGIASNVRVLLQPAPRYEPTSPAASRLTRRPANRVIVMSVEQRSRLGLRSGTPLMTRRAAAS
jgi:hypothetical protein